MARRHTTAGGPPSDLLTTQEAAALLGVGTTSIKRWADAGLLECVKTPGGHRRFPRSAVIAFVDPERTGAAAPATALATLDPGTEEAAGQWIDLLLREHDSARIVDELTAARARLGTWFEVAEMLTPVVHEIGRRWATGQITVIQEHIAAERLGRALTVCAERAPALGRRTALLMTAEGEEHTLGLSLVELCLRHQGWQVLWVGRKTPIYLAREFLARRKVELVCVSASEYSQDALALRDQAERLGEVCRSCGIALLLGGHGQWPEVPTHGARVHTFAELAAFLEAM
jgi:excisionase family DNA binding protein